MLHHSFFVLLIYIRLFGRSGCEYAAIHDAHEAYTGDIPKPIKERLRAGVARTEDPIKRVESEYDDAIASFLKTHTVGQSDSTFASRYQDL